MIVRQETSQHWKFRIRGFSAIYLSVLPLSIPFPSFSRFHAAVSSRNQPVLFSNQIKRKKKTTTPQKQTAYVPFDTRQLLPFLILHCCCAKRGLHFSLPASRRRSFSAFLALAFSMASLRRLMVRHLISSG